MAAESGYEIYSGTETFNKITSEFMSQSVQYNLPNRSPFICSTTPESVASSSQENGEKRDSLAYSHVEIMNGIESLPLSQEEQGNLPDISIFVCPVTASSPFPEPVASSSQEGGKYSNFGSDSYFTNLWTSGDTMDSQDSSFIESQMNTDFTPLLPCSQLDTVDSSFLESQVDADMMELLPSNNMTSRQSDNLQGDKHMTELSQCNHLTASHKNSMQDDTHKVELSRCSQLTSPQNNYLLQSPRDSHLTELVPFTPPAYTQDNSTFKFQDSSFSQVGETSFTYPCTTVQSHIPLSSPSLSSIQVDSVMTPASQSLGMHLDSPMRDTLSPCSDDSTNPFVNCLVEEGNLSNATAQEPDNDSTVDAEINSFIHDPENRSLLIKKLEEAISSSDTEQNSPQPSTSQMSFDNPSSVHVQHAVQKHQRTLTRVRS